MRLSWKVEAVEIIHHQTRTALSSASSEQDRFRDDALMKPVHQAARLLDGSSGCQ